MLFGASDGRGSFGSGGVFGYDFLEVLFVYFHLEETNLHLELGVADHFGDAAFLVHRMYPYIVAYFKLLRIRSGYACFLGQFHFGDSASEPFA